MCVCIQNLRSSTTCESCSSLESHVLFMKYTPSKPSLSTGIGINDHAFIVINLPSYSPIFMKRTDSNSQRYWNWQNLNQYDGVQSSLLIGQNLQQQMKNHRLHEIIMMVQESNSNIWTFDYFFYLTCWCTFKD